MDAPQDDPQTTIEMIREDVKIEDDRTLYNYKFKIEPLPEQPESNEP